jgi:hypothetical protein
MEICMRALQTGPYHLHNPSLSNVQLRDMPSSRPLGSSTRLRILSTVWRTSSAFRHLRHISYSLDVYPMLKIDPISQTFPSLEQISILRTTRSEYTEIDRRHGHLPGYIIVHRHVLDNTQVLLR